MVVIRATESELELSGSISDLQQIRDALLDIGNVSRVAIDANCDVAAAPYDRVLKRIEVELLDGPVRVTVVNDSLQVTGGDQMLEIFASFFDFDPSAGPGAHCHHDWLDGDVHIAEDSRSLVISVA